MSERRLLSITEVGDATGLPSSALRYYEKAGLLTSADRVGGRRHYDHSVLHRLAVIALLQEAGFTIAEIADLVGSKGGRRRWRELAQAKLDEIEAHLGRVEAARELLRSAVDCGCSELESCGLVEGRRGRHRKAVQTVSLRMGPPP